MSDIVAATGHRPEKLGGYGDDVLRRLIRLATRYLNTTNPKEVITGMALGWDTAVALAAIRLDIPFIAALPFEGQDGKWSPEQRTLYRNILAYASEVVIVASGGYSANKYQTRNEWMADHCTHIVALWDGSAGGTSNMLRYAAGPGRWRRIDNLWEVYLNEMDRNIQRANERDSGGAT